MTLVQPTATPGHEHAAGIVPAGRLHRLRQALTVSSMAVTSRWWLPLLIAVGGLAFLTRLQMAVRGGGLLSIGAYDDGVHLSAAAAMLHGRVPYRDFLFLQAPGMLLAASPFAFLGQLVGDPTALRTFRIAFEFVGALNAVAVMLVLRRFGLPAAVTGGLFYAVFPAAVYDERTALLEPVGTLGVLVALGVLPRAQTGRRRWFLIAGIALGVACDFKIWYAVAALVVVVFARGGRWPLLAGLVAAGAVAWLPFLLLAPHDLIQQAILDQLGRPRRVAATIPLRLRSLLGITGIKSGSPLPGVPAQGMLLVLLPVTIAATAVAAFDRRSRLAVAVGVADLAVVLAAPSYFAHYAALTASLLAVVVGVGVAWLAGRRSHRWLRSTSVGVVVIVIVGLSVRHDLEPVDVRPPGAALQRAATGIRGCIIADDPTLLAVMNVLSRDLNDGCPLRPDVSGYSYGPDAQLTPAGPTPRPKNQRYQAGLVRYMTSGDAFIRVRRDTTFSRASAAALDAHPVLFRDGRYVIRHTR